MTGPAAAALDVGPFRDVPYMGVIFVVAEAMKRGFVNGHPEWCNLGQGQPEVGELAGAPPRIERVDLEPGDHAYGPLEGTPELRAAIAEHYNRRFRPEGAKKYGPQHVAVANGGRLVLSRVLAGLGATTVGYQLPDYTAYEDMLDLHLARLTPYPIRAREERGFLIDPDEVVRAMDEAGLGAFLVSNPCNPTGRYLDDASLRTLLDGAREHGTTLLLDEFYSDYVFTPNADGTSEPAAGPHSVAALVDDPDHDPVLIVDGLTKNHRYPGWRIGWVIGPPKVVETIARVASALDGGPSRVAQRAALSALDPYRATRETAAVRREFSIKRDITVRRLRDMGVRFAGDPDSTFYVWGCLDDLPAPLNDAMSFFWRALDHQVMTVPGQFFDVNPGKRRRGPAHYTNWMRFSFGPPRDNLEIGLDRLATMVEDAS